MATQAEKFNQMIKEVRENLNKANEAYASGSDENIVTDFLSSAVKIIFEATEFVNKEG